MNEIEEFTIEQIKVWNGQRVVTFKDINAAHGKKNGTAQRNFERNRKHFIENVDFVVLRPMDTNYGDRENPNATDCHIRGGSNTTDCPVRGIDAIPNRGITLFTESGYLMIVKSFDDDLSWDVQRQLVNGYFRAKAEIGMGEPRKIEGGMSKTHIPDTKDWYARNRRRIARISERDNISRTTLYHYILERIGEIKDLDEANRIYEEENGFPPKYALDVVGYFEELAEIADEYLDMLEKM